ncbi:hypothetical protein L1987_46242 [Smallanthus sonchifolius]|uniref:Uncharacterized protein n=1 Tax=Smallanthus sonchifolius TaxID=185202 RepID=A0ACB9G0Y6_9ASTR|nr:hypothetical protein L1987_46242 [Smallanthus sonchifolius]
MLAHMKTIYILFLPTHGVSFTSLYSIPPQAFGCHAWQPHLHIIPLFGICSITVSGPTPTLSSGRFPGSVSSEERSTVDVTSLPQNT